MLNDVPDATSVRTSRIEESSAPDASKPFLLSKRIVEVKGTTPPLETGAVALTGQIVEQLRLVPSAVHYKPESAAHDVFLPLQRWEGTIIEILKDSFVARLVDKSPDSATEEAEFPLDEVSRDDLPLIKEGALFYWTIGYRDSINGQRTRISEIRFRRTPTWTASELTRARGRARRLLDLLGW